MGEATRDTQRLQYQMTNIAWRLNQSGRILRYGIGILRGRWERWIGTSGGANLGVAPV